MAHQENSTERSGKRRGAGIAALAALVLGGSLIIMVLVPSKTAVNPVPQSQTVGTTFRKDGTLTFISKKDEYLTSIDIEIADDDSKRETGLMGRPAMEEQQGMLFIFQEERSVDFWMKNTIIPLDMIFVDSRNVVVTIQRNTTPYSEQTYSSGVPVLYVIEVVAGFADRHQIVPGSKVTWKRL
ncbi:MAG TPA: DUF192 domain-containing protein [Bacteroidota bacterium]|nr:DUF192 domain-containing protein [Bacteroidota bacterium]